jgi:hypothetical protein
MQTRRQVIGRRVCSWRKKSRKKAVKPLRDRIVEAINSAMDAYFLSVFEQLVQMFAGIISNIMSLAQNVLDYPIVINGMLFAQGLAFTLLIIKVAGEALQTWVLHANGDPEADPRGLLIATGKSAAIIAGTPWLVRQMYVLGTQVAYDISQLGGVINADANLYNLITMWPGMAIVKAGAGIFALLMLLIIFIQTFIRAAVLGMLAAIGPILAVQIVGGGELFGAWLKELSVVCFSQAIQIFLLMAAMYALPGVAVANPLTGMLMLLGWLWATVKAPGVLKQLIFSSGAGGAAAGVAQSAGSMIIMRKILMRGA